jgi:hypothetical protein
MDNLSEINYQQFSKKMVNNPTSQFGRLGTRYTNAMTINSHTQIGKHSASSQGVPRFSFSSTSSLNQTDLSMIKTCILNNQNLIRLPPKVKLVKNNNSTNPASSNSLTAHDNNNNSPNMKMYSGSITPNSMQQLNSSLDTTITSNTIIDTTTAPTTQGTRNSFKFFNRCLTVFEKFLDPKM